MPDPLDGITEFALGKSHNALAGHHGAGYCPVILDTTHKLDLAFSETARLVPVPSFPPAIQITTRLFPP